jgi:hypothetical protein
MGLRLTVKARNMISHLSSLGYPITHAANLTILHNGNDAYVKWCHNVTTEGNHHIEHPKNATCKWVADGTIAVQHISIISNIADIFTKEIGDGANFRRLCDAFMCRSSNYLCNAHSIACSAPTTVHPHMLPLDTPVLLQSTRYV